jgi:hypothetical protein
LQYVAEREFEANNLSMLCNLFTSTVGYLPVMQELRMRDEMELSWGGTGVQADLAAVL